MLVNRIINQGIADNNNDCINASSYVNPDVVKFRRKQTPVKTIEGKIPELFFIRFIYSSIACPKLK